MLTKVVVYVSFILAESAGYVLEYVIDIGEGPAMSLTLAKSGRICL